MTSSILAAALVGNAPDFAALDLARSCRSNFPHVRFLVAPGRRKEIGASILAFADDGEPVVGAQRQRIVVYIAGFSASWEGVSL